MPFEPAFESTPFLVYSVSLFDLYFYLSGLCAQTPSLSKLLCVLNYSHPKCHVMFSVCLWHVILLFVYEACDSIVVCVLFVFNLPLQITGVTPLSRVPLDIITYSNKKIILIWHTYVHVHVHTYLKLNIGHIWWQRCSHALMRYEPMQLILMVALLYHLSNT